MNPKLSYVISGFFGGVLLRSFVDLGFAMAGFLTLLSLVLFCATLGVEQAEHKKVFVLIACFCLGASLGVVRYEWRDQSHRIQTPDFWGHSEKCDECPISGVRFEGVINEEPVEGDSTV